MAVSPPQSPQPGVSLDRDHRKSLVIAGGVAAVILGLLIAWPTDLLEKLFWICAGLCAQRPAHSYFFDGQQLPMEARMIGIFGGFSLTAFGLWFVGRSRAGLLPPLGLRLLFLGFVAAMGLDGLNATFYDLHWFTLYQPQNWLRLLTGTLSGIGIAALALPLFNFTVWQRPWRTSSFNRWREVPIALAGGMLLIGATVSGWGIFFWPLAFISVIGTVAVMVVFNYIIFVVLFRRENAARDAWDLLAPLAFTTLLSLIEFGLMSMLRYSLLGTSVY